MPLTVEKLQSIQVLRAMAALGVLAFHALSPWAIAEKVDLGAAKIGAFGVDLFFVISGFIVWRAAQHAPSAATFLRNRYIRVAPVYYLLTLPWLAMALVGGRPVAAPLATGLFFWPVWGSEATRPLCGAGWTLCFEALFYCSLGFVVQFGRRAVIGLAVAYAAALMLNSAGDGGVFQFLGSPLLLEFLLGVGVAARPVRGRQRAGLAALLAAGAVLAFWGVRGIGDATNWLRAYEPFVAFSRVGMAGLPSVLILWGALQIEPWFKGRIANALSFLGDASYSIYLTHQWVIVALVEAVWHLTGAPLVLLPFVGGALGLGAGVWVYRNVEKPLLAFLNRKPLEPVAVTAE